MAKLLLGLIGEMVVRYYAYLPVSHGYRERERDRERERSERALFSPGEMKRPLDLPTVNHFSARR